jgi:hypothetical protein
MKKNYPVIFTLFSIMILLSCKRDKFEPYFGPQACPGEGFQISTAFNMSKVDPATVNFFTGEALTFNAVFNSNALWKIEISGQSSHATKTFQGFSNVVSINWYGRSDTELFFADEKVTVKFFITCKEELTVIQSVNIKKADFSKDPNVIIVSDFDSHLAPGWGYYNVSDPLYPPVVGDTAICPVTNKPGFCSTFKPSPQGGRSLSYIGQVPISGGGQKNIFAAYEVYPPNLNTFPNAPTDPNQLWFNFLGNSGSTPVKVIVSFRHWDGVTKFGRTSFTINSPTWQMYSVNLGQLEKGVGDVQTFNAKDLGLIIFTIAQNAGISPTEFNIDLATLTIGESFLGQQVQK